MNISSLSIFSRRMGSILLLSLLFHGTRSIYAFPPAPHHLFYGLVRDQYGTPLNSDNTEIILETSAGQQIKTQLIPGLNPGSNYELSVPMDAGLSSDLYKPTALRPNVPFKIKVRIGSAVYLPIELHGDFAQLGRAGQRTHLDLTLGEDSDGDGLPDAWERMINPDISKVNPGDDSDHDGLLNLQEYIAGTYAFDPTDGFILNMVRMQVNVPVLEFLAIQGHTYQILGSDDFTTWVPVPFQVISDGLNGLVRQSYYSTDVKKIQVTIPAGTQEHPLKFFKLKGQ